eukprot:389700_1
MDTGHDTIYAFTANNPAFLIKYVISSDTVSIADIPRVCISYFFRVITGNNNKIYIHGCYSTPWKTLIFDIDSEHFETRTIDIHTPTQRNMLYYRTG